MMVSGRSSVCSGYKLSDEEEEEMQDRERERQRGMEDCCFLAWPRLSVRVVFPAAAQPRARPQYTPLNATHDLVGFHTLLHLRWKEFE